MKHEPLLTFPCLRSQNGKRQQYIATLSVKTLLHLVEPTLGHEDLDSTLRADRIAVNRLAEMWFERGEPESVRPVVLAVRNGGKFVRSQDLPKSGLGYYKIAMDAVLEVCDGIQRLMAIKQAIKKYPEWLTNEWPVHIVETTGTEDLPKLNQMIRRQAELFAPRSRGSGSKSQMKEWTRSVLAASGFLRVAVALDKSTLAPRSKQLWTESAVTKTFTKLISDKQLKPTQESAIAFAKLWDNLAIQAPILNEYQNRKVTAAQLREQTVLPLASAFHALATGLAQALDSGLPERKRALTRLANLDWTPKGDWPRTSPRSHQTETWTRKVLRICQLTTL